MGGLVPLLLALTYAVGWLGFRVAELLPACLSHPSESLVICSALFFVCLIQIKRPVSLSITIVAVLAAASAYLDSDAFFTVQMPATVHGTYLITGANSGIGFHTAQTLAQRGGNVILACRNAAKCDEAASTISSTATGQVVALSGLDLLDWRSIDAFVEKLDSSSPLRDIDGLLNNAGFGMPAGTPVDKQGLEPHFGAMHIGHFYLTERLAERSTRPLRVVNLASATHHLCALPFYLLPDLSRSNLKYPPGCLDDAWYEEGVNKPSDPPAYFRAKISNVHHAHELPLHHGHVTSIAVDQGWVGTNIQPWMKGPFSPTNLAWMRHADVGVHPVVVALTVDEAQLRAQMNKEAGGRGLVIDTLGQIKPPFQDPWWSASLGLDSDAMTAAGEKLWQKSTEFLKTRRV